MRKHERRFSGFGEHRARIAGDRDNRDAHLLEMIDHRLELGGLAALRDQDRDVAVRGHPKVAVDRLGQVQECCGCPRRREGRRDLAPHMTRLAEAAHDQLAFARDN